MVFFLVELGQKIKDICLDGFDGKAILLRIVRRHFDGFFGNIERRHARRTALGDIQRKGARVREAVEDTAPLPDLRRREAIEFLVKEEARLLPVLHVNRIANAVLHDIHPCLLCRRIQQRRAIEALVLLHPLQLTDLDIISFIDTGDRELPLPQHFDEAVQEFLLMPLHPQ